MRNYAAIDSRIRLIQNSKRLGIAECYKCEGLRQARGEYMHAWISIDITRK